MIYYYLVIIKYIKGKQDFIKEYRLSFYDISKFFVFLEKKHKDNYTLLCIKSLKYVNGYQRYYDSFLKGGKLIDYDKE